MRISCLGVGSIWGAIWTWHRNVGLTMGTALRHLFKLIWGLAKQPSHARFHFFNQQHLKTLILNNFLLGLVWFGVLCLCLVWAVWWVIVGHGESSLVILRDGYNGSYIINVINAENNVWFNLVKYDLHYRGAAKSGRDRAWKITSSLKRQRWTSKQTFYKEKF